MHDRRIFLRTVTAACATGLSIGCSSNRGRSPANGPVPAGNVKDVPVGTLKAVGGEPVILGRDASGLYAMTAICTHESCDMTEDGSIGSTIVTCNCHGSRFDANGAVRTGPARSPLAHYRVDLAADGTITVQAGQIVSTSVRVPVA